MRKQPSTKQHPHHLIALLGLFGGTLLGILLQLGYQHLERPKIIAPDYTAESMKKPAFVVKKEKKMKEQREAKIRLPIIMYHYVENVTDPLDKIKNSLTISPYVFEQHLRDLAENGYETYFVRDMPDILSGKLVPEPKSVILTFDDGYEDFYTDVLPLLKRYHMKATQYVIYDYIGRKGFLNSREIEALIDSGLVEIGAHTLDHVYLKDMDRTVAEKQIQLSKTKLEEDFGITVDSFAYPFGAFDEQAVELATANYRVAVSVIPGIMHSNSNKYYLPRIRAGVLGYQASQVLDNYTETP